MAISTKKIFSMITQLSFLLAFALTFSCDPNREYGQNDLFKINALNDSLHLFLQGAEDIPKANYPTVIYIFAYQYEDNHYVEFQSFPGYEMYVSLDTTMAFFIAGKYLGKYLTIYSSPSMKGYFNKKTIRNLSLNNGEQRILESKPIYFGEEQMLYRRWKKYKVISSDIVLVFQSSTF